MRHSHESGIAETGVGANIGHADGPKGELQEQHVIQLENHLSDIAPKNIVSLDPRFHGDDSMDYLAATHTVTSPHHLRTSTPVSHSHESGIAETGVGANIGYADGPKGELQEQHVIQSK